MAETNEFETTIKRRVEAERNVFLMKLFRNKSSGEITELLEELILDAIRVLDEKTACQLLETHFVALVDVARDRTERSGGEPSTRDGSRACAHVAMELWPKIHDAGVGLFADSKQPPEMVRAMLFERVAQRWCITTDEDEAERIFRFIVGVNPYRDYEADGFLRVIRKATDGKFPPMLAVESCRIICAIAEYENVENHGWLQAVARILLISVARFRSLDEIDVMLEAYAKHIKDDQTF